LDAHAKVKTLLDLLEPAPVYDHTWVPKFQELHQLVQQHVALEENEMFPRAAGIMTPQEAEELGVTVETAKQRSGGTLPRRKGERQRTSSSHSNRTELRPCEESLGSLPGQTGYKSV
jgi:hypothetical protein